MPPAAVRSPRPGNRPPAQALPPIPFTAAAHEHSEPIVTDTTLALGAAQQVRGPFDVPAYGFLRHVFLEVLLSGGALGAGALNPDHPYNIIQNLTLSDVNGAPIFGPLDGFATKWANVIGGYGGDRQDPGLGPWFSNTINGKFWLRVPIEISRHNGYGSLANQNAAAAYKLSWTLATSAQAYSTAPTTPASVQVKAWLEAWSQPNAVDLTGRPQMREPIGHGTTQFWSSFTKGGIAAGNQNVLLPRVGNLIRALVFICRDATGARVDTVMPDPIQIAWDARLLNVESQNYRTQRMMEAIAATAARDTGVFAYSFANSLAGHDGDDDPNLWLPTVQSTRLELDGVNAAAGTIQVITNDIAPAEVRPDERYVENSTTGFHPNVGQPVPQAM
jgi:hypothetical protein